MGPRLSTSPHGSIGLVPAGSEPWGSSVHQVWENPPGDG